MQVAVIQLLYFYGGVGIIPEYYILYNLLSVKHHDAIKWVSCTHIGYNPAVITERDNLIGTMGGVGMFHNAVDSEFLAVIFDYRVGVVHKIVSPVPGNYVRGRVENLVCKPQLLKLPSVRVISPEVLKGVRGKMNFLKRTIKILFIDFEGALAGFLIIGEVEHKGIACRSVGCIFMYHR